MHNTRLAQAIQNYLLMASNSTVHETVDSELLQGQVTGVWYYAAVTVNLCKKYKIILPMENAKQHQPTEADIHTLCHVNIFPRNLPSMA